MINTLLASKDVHIKQCEGRVEELEKKIDELLRIDAAMYCALGTDSDD